MMDTLRYHFSCVADFWRGGLKKRTIVLGIVLAASALLGYFTCLSAPEVTNAVMEYFASVMAESGIVSETGTISALDLFLNNWIALLTCVAYGFFPFLFLPVFVIFSNAYLIGAMGAYYAINGLPASAFLAGILPHGFFELSALALAGAMGYTICLTLVKKISHAPNTPPMGELVSDVLRTLLMVALPLLLIAAAVEAFITPAVMSLFLP